MYNLLVAFALLLLLARLSSKKKCSGSQAKCRNVTQTVWATKTTTTTTGFHNARYVLSVPVSPEVAHSHKDSLSPFPFLSASASVSISNLARKTIKRGARSEMGAKGGRNWSRVDRFYLLGCFFLFFFLAPSLLGNLLSVCINATLNDQKMSHSLALALRIV